MARILFTRSRKPGQPSRFLRNKKGGELALAMPLRSGALRRAPDAPYGWRNITPVLSVSLPGQKPGKLTEYRINSWLLVLAAKKIPHWLQPLGDASRVYVPPVYEGVALHEISAFEQERPRPIFVAPSREHAGWILGFFFLLFLWHGLRFHWFSFSLPVPPFPVTAAEWPRLFGLDILRVRVGGELWRCVTALTLHADTAHLLGNTVFGMFFFVPLCRRAGVGMGLLLAVLAGATGNALNSLFKDMNVVSLGFSTALFGSLGSLCAFSMADVFSFQSREERAGSAKGFSGIKPLLRRSLVYVGAGLALLGFLGGGAEVRTDYAAHIWGFLAGLIVAFLIYPLDSRLHRLAQPAEHRAQITLAILALLLLVFAWLYAFVR